MLFLSAVMAGSVYLDATEEAVDVESFGEEEGEESQEHNDSLFIAERYETPQVEFERQLSTAIQEFGQSDDDSGDDEVLNDLKPDHFGEEPVMSQTELFTMLFIPQNRIKHVQLRLNLNE